jgi:hypothetical protein
MWGGRNGLAHRLNRTQEVMDYNVLQRGAALAGFIYFHLLPEKLSKKRRDESQLSSPAPGGISHAEHSAAG